MNGMVGGYGPPLVGLRGLAHDESLWCRAGEGSPSAHFLGPGSASGAAGMMHDIVQSQSAVAEVGIAVVRAGGLDHNRLLCGVAVGGH